MPQQRSTDHFELKPAQQRVLGVLKSEGASRLTRARYEELSGVSRSQAAYDLAELVEHGILERLGSGRATRYRIVHVSAPGRSGRRRWTPERIRTGLESFCDGRETWPSATEFKRAGHFDLYVAASRYGGIRFWTSELGLTREPKPVPPATAPRRRRFRPRLQWVPAAAVAALALALAGGGHIQLSTGGAVVEAAAPQLLAAPSLKPPSVRPRAQHAGPARHAKPAARPARTTPAQQLRPRPRRPSWPRSSRPRRPRRPRLRERPLRHLLGRLHRTRRRFPRLPAAAPAAPAPAAARQLTKEIRHASPPDAHRPLTEVGFSSVAVVLMLAASLPSSAVAGTLRRVIRSTGLQGSNGWCRGSAGGNYVVLHWTVPPDHRCQLQWLRAGYR